MVRPAENGSKRYEVIAGNRRLAALKEVHRGEKQDPKIGCEVREVDDSTADALSLSENFVREAMHPLDEAEAFAKLASDEGKGVEVIAVEFGVSKQYVRQRMKLASLASSVKAAYRESKIDTGMAEAFSSVPEEKQMEVWKEVGGNPRHAEHVRNIIANGWIDAKLAIFDLSALPDSVVSGDLFSERVLVERAAFMEAQGQALETQRHELVEEGWKEVVIGDREEVYDRLQVMDIPPSTFDRDTTRELAKIDNQREKLGVKYEQCPEDDESAMNAIQQELDGLLARKQEIVDRAPKQFTEEIKAVGTVFVMLCPDGQVRHEFRVPRQRSTSTNSNGRGGEVGVVEQVKPPTSEDLSDGQLGTTFTHQALAVRQALLKNRAARKRMLVLLLHEKIRSEALAIRHDTNDVTLHAGKEEFTSPAFEHLREQRASVDPL